VAAAPIAGEGGAGQADRQDQPPPPRSMQVGVKQVRGAADVGAAHVGHPAARESGGEPGQLVGDLGGVDRLEAGGGGHGDHRQPGQAGGDQQDQLVELGGP
jgi:hypothetical protein